MMTMKEMKRAIVKSFKEVYGFAPTQKSIVPLESCGYEEEIEWMAFSIGGKGYAYKAYGTVERAESYDM